VIIYLICSLLPLLIAPSIIFAAYVLIMEDDEDNVTPPNSGGSSFFLNTPTPQTPRVRIPVPSELDKQKIPGTSDWLAIYDPRYKPQFQTWLNKTEWGLAEASLSKEYLSKISWDLTERDLSSNYGWEHFHQGALITDGFPKVMCKRCSRVVNHPRAKKKGSLYVYGISMLKTHLQTQPCKIAAERSGLQQLVMEDIGNRSRIVSNLNCYS
jgi:hypothetical protein